MSPSSVTSLVAFVSALSAAVIWLGWVGRPTARLPPGAIAHSDTRATRSTRHLDEWVGLLLVAPFRRGRTPLPTATGWHSRIGAAVIAVVPALLVRPALAPIAIIGGLAWPSRRRSRDRRRRADTVDRALPDMVDLLSLAIGAGCNPLLAITAVASRIDGPLAVELATVLRDVTRGQRLADALDDVPARAGESIRPVITALVASERYGTPLLDALNRVAADVRSTRRQHDEARARQAPVKLLFPLITCTLPAFALLTIAPLIAGGVRSLRV